MVFYDYYFIGVGGISMSALCQLLYEKGYNVAGSDAYKSITTKNIAKRGIKVFYSANYKAIANAKCVVVSSAISDDDKELRYAVFLRKNIITRGELLAKISKNYQYVIAVSGAHGKTTTTALISHIFASAGEKPTVHIGGILQQNHKNYINGGKKYFITEACEYKDNFLYLHPNYSVILNIEPEHLDYFKNFDNVKKSFIKFSNQSAHFISLKDYFQQGLFTGNNADVLGIDYTYKNYIENSEGIEFDCYHKGKFLIHVKTKLYGEYNAKNVLCAIACANYFGIDKNKIAQSLQSFKGVCRRFEKYEFSNGSSIIFDYAHHPTEIECAIASAKKHCDGKLIVIFQPHTYSRTLKLFDHFLKCFEKADRLIIFKTYPAREKYNKKGSAKVLCQALSMLRQAEYSEDYGLLENLSNQVEKEDCILVLGAGDFYDKCGFVNN